MPLAAPFSKSYWMAGARLDPILDVGPEPQNSLWFFPRHRHFHGKERRVLDFYADFFDGRDKNIAFRVLAQNRRKKPHEGGAADRRAAVKPRPVSGDPHVDIAAIRRIPLLHRRQCLLRGVAFGCGQGFNIQGCAGRGLLSAPGNKLFGHNLCPIAMPTSKRFDHSHRALYSYH